MREVAVSSCVSRRRMVVDNWYTTKGAADKVKELRAKLRAAGWTATESREEVFSNGPEVYMTESAWRALK